MASDAPHLVMSSDPRATSPASAELSTRAATMARQIADLLDQTCTEESDAAGAARFLRSFADAAGPAVRPRTEAAPIDRLTARFGLDPREQALIVLAGLADEHEGIASVFQSLHPRGEPRPTLGLAAQLLVTSQGERAGLRRLVVGGRAARFGIVRMNADAPFYERTLRLADGLWDALHGHDEPWPASIGRIVLPAPPPGLDAWVERPPVARARDALRSKEDRTVLVVADDETIAAGRIARLVAALGVPAVAGRLERPDPGEVALVVAHAAARGAVPVVFLGGPDDGAATAGPALDLGALPGPVVVSAMSGAVRPVGSRPVLTVPVDPIGADGRRRAWQVTLPDLAVHSIELAARHPLDPAVTAEVAADVRSRQRLAGGLRDLREISEVIRARAGVTLPPGVRLGAPEVEWSRLILPPVALEHLKDAVARLHHQATVLDDWGFLQGARADRGVRLLFTGPPGTGKSLAAEVVATEAGTDLLVVDVSQVISKWIGETEKNLARIFDAAERTQAVLLLDEADALFASRTEVSDAHDRYANLQTAYLLQRLDHFDGLSVLATNLRQNIDPAFVRRMDFVVEFVLPDAALRRQMWDVHLPRPAPVAPDVDLDEFALRYPVPGAWIRNAAIGAAFLAAADDVPIDTTHLAKAMRREYDKAARPFPGPPERAEGAGSEPSTSRRPSGRHPQSEEEEP